MAFNFGVFEIQRIIRVDLVIYFSDLYIQNRSRERTPPHKRKLVRCQENFFGNQSDEKKNRKINSDEVRKREAIMKKMVFRRAAFYNYLTIKYIIVVLF